MIRTLIVDDEPLAREKVARHLAAHLDIEVVGEAGDGETAVRQIRALEPDLIFLDIHLPEFDAFEVLRRANARKPPAVIFVTAYDEHALKAFEVHALDYLVKPFDDARFRLALDRGREQIGHQRVRGDAMFERLLVHRGGAIRIIKLGDIDWIESAGNYVRLHVGPEAYLHRQTMQHMEETLDSARFVRIHRRSIVNVDRIRELRPLFKGSYTVVMEDGTELTLSPVYRGRLSL